MIFIVLATIRAVILSTHSLTKGKFKGQQQKSFFYKIFQKVIESKLTLRIFMVHIVTKTPLHLHCFKKKNSLFFKFHYVPKLMDLIDLVVFFFLPCQWCVYWKKKLSFCTIFFCFQIHWGKTKFANCEKWSCFFCP